MRSPQRVQSRGTAGFTQTRTSESARGFTLIELLVVIAIIGMLASIVLASLSSARQKGKTARRAADLHELQQALELYNNDHNAYPIDSSWQSQCVAWGGLAASNVIPGLVPAYIAAMPVDPDMNASANTCCYLYYSNGADYKILDHNCPTVNYQSISSLIDPARDSGSNACLVDGTGIWSWAVYTSGGCGW